MDKYKSVECAPYTPPIAKVATGYVAIFLLTILSVLGEIIIKCCIVAMGVVMGAGLIAVGLLYEFHIDIIGILQKLQ